MSLTSLDLTHNVLSGVDEAYWKWDRGNKDVFYSAKLSGLLGYRNKDSVASSVLWESCLDTSTLSGVKLKIYQHLKGTIPLIDVTIPIINNLGHALWIHAVGKVVERVNGRATLLFGTVKDVTATKNMITILKKQNDWLMLAERISHSGHWRFDLKNESLSWSAEIFNIHGIVNNSVTPSIQKAEEAFVVEDRYKFRTFLNNAIHKKEPFYFKSILIQQSGKKVNVEVIAEIERDNYGEVLAIFGVYKNVTHNEVLLQKLKLLAMVNFTIKVPIFFIDDNDHVVYQDISPNQDDASSALFNYINFSITDYMGFKKQAKVQGQIKETNVSFDKYVTVFDLSVTYEAEKGIYIWIVENVTDKFRKEQQQVISNRLALLGNTFGNVSHDINNVLGVALGAIEMLEMKFSRGEKDISDYIERVKNAIDKGKDVTERLLAFTHKPTVKVVSFDPIQEIYDNQYLFKQLLISTIKVTFNFKPIYCLITFPQGEFINMLLNLVLNAQDAIQNKGVSGHIEISANLLDNNHLEIHVKDSGIGITKDNITKIFDPFYSSKSVNKGNGIGLANVYSTMYKHNGVIQVEGSSELGGAHFTLVFKCETLEEKYSPKDIQITPLCYQDTTILVLDDEVSIAEFVALFLEGKGASVIVANNKQELIDNINSGVVFDIFITDMILPDLSGKEAVEMVIEKFPDIAVFSMSGYIALEDNSWDYPVLRKPFNSKELAQFLSDYC